MENSQQMLANQLRISQEEEARTFHSNLYLRRLFPYNNIICRAFEGLAVWRDIWDEELSGAGLKSARFRGRETIKTRILLYEQELIIIMNRRENSISR